MGLPTGESLIVDESNFRQKKTALALVLISVGVALALSEFAARRVVSLKPVPDFGKSLLTRVRLWEPNLDLEYDVRGLYPGADKVKLRTSSLGLIEPQPGAQDRAKPRVLFLGGSTTESLYLPEAQRWVAQLSWNAGIHAFNGGQSGANTLDKNFGFSSLTEKQVYFDLVVLMTSVNDFAWQMRFRKINAPFREENYFESLNAHYKSEFEQDLNLLDRCGFSLALCEMARRTAAAWADRARAQRLSKITKGKEIGNVAVTYLTNIQVSEHPVELGDVQNEVDQSLAAYRDNAIRNLGRLKQSIDATGARFLVLSEPLSFSGSTESFHLDLRGNIQIGEKALSHRAAADLFDRLNAAYLEAARRVGAQTFDLASEMKVSSQEMGTLFYDGMHYTPKGAHRVAALLAPVLKAAMAHRLP